MSKYVQTSTPFPGKKPTKKAAAPKKTRKKTQEK